MKKIFTITHFLISLCISSYVYSQIPSNGLVGEFLFNGNGYDNSGNCNNGIVIGASLTEDRFGRKNSAYYFNGTIDNYIAIPLAFNLQTNEYSYSVWCELASLPDLGNQFFVISNGNAYNDQFINAVNKVGIFNGWNAAGYNFGPPNQYILNSKKELEIKKWTHIVLTRATNGMKLFVNGKLEALDTTNFSVQPSYGLDGVYIGMRSNSTYSFHGKIDDIRIYDRAITEDEVDTLYKEHVCFLKIAVTDTLIINANLTSLFPINYKINIKVYPNPTLDHLIIDSGNISELLGYSFKITNASGIDVFQSNIDKPIFDLNMNQWQGKGLYLLYLYDSNMKVVDVKKIILQ